MKIINKYHKRLAFIVDGETFGIEAKEIKEVDDRLGSKLLESVWIEEVKDISQTKKIDIQDNKQKGRKTLKTK